MWLAVLTGNVDMHKTGVEKTGEAFEMRDEDEWRKLTLEEEDNRLRRIFYTDNCCRMELNGTSWRNLAK